MKIAIGSDHAGFELKNLICQYIKEKGESILDFGAFSSESVDYPDFAFPVSEAVSGEIADLGILICGTGTGMSITANKVKGIRAASCVTPEMAELARTHNNANIVCFGSRLIDLETAKKIVDVFINTGFEGGRHSLRVEKIHKLTEC